MTSLSPASWAAPFHLSQGPECPRVVDAIVEVPKGSRNKYEMDKRSGLIRLDRHLYSASHYPGDYGFLPGTYADDGDALDVLIMLNDPSFAGCLIEVRVVGLFRMSDGGHEDFKILGVPNSDPLFRDVCDLTSVPAHFLREVEYFFSTYKALEGGSVTTAGWGDAQEAQQVIEKAIADFQAQLA